jgi:hypothetical protein
VEEELPLRVVPDEEWERELQEAKEVGRIVDRHLDYEARGRLLMELEDFQSEHLCPEQRVQMATDICATQLGAR